MLRKSQNYNDFDATYLLDYLFIYFMKLLNLLSKKYTIGLENKALLKFWKKKPINHYNEKDTYLFGEKN